MRGRCLGRDFEVEDRLEHVAEMRITEGMLNGHGRSDWNGSRQTADASVALK